MVLLQAKQIIVVNGLERPVRQAAVRGRTSASTLPSHAAGRFEIEAGLKVHPMRGDRLTAPAFSAGRSFPSTSVSHTGRLSATQATAGCSFAGAALHRFRQNQTSSAASARSQAGGPLLNRQEDGVAGLPVDGDRESGVRSRRSVGAQDELYRVDADRACNRISG
jgi:hypothetical protein